MVKILVTGGAGFIGTNFIYYMLNKYPEYKMVCLDALTYAGKKSNLDDALKSKWFKFVKGNICDTDLVFNLFKEESFDIVVNFAAESHVDRSIKSPALFLNTNIIGTQVLLDASVKHKTSRFHQISTDEVYGDLSLDKSEISFTEKDLLKPSSPYSVSKASADLLVLSYYRTFGLPVTISRSTNNYGPYQFEEKLIPKIITNVVSNREVPIYGTGKNVRDWIYVEDHCDAIDAVIHRGKVGEIYNVSGNNEIDNITLARMIIKKLNKSEDLIEYIEDRPGHDMRYSLDSEKIYKELGIKAKTDFPEGINKTIEWYLNKIISGNRK